MAAAVQPRAAGEQAVAVRYLAHALVRAARRGDGAGAAILPQIDIVLRIERDHALAGGA